MEAHRSRMIEEIERKKRNDTAMSVSLTNQTMMHKGQESRQLVEDI